MPTSLIMHIGLHKTGTTALQEFLGRNRDVLRSAGVVYPKGNHLLSECWPENSPANGLVEQRWAKVKKALQQGETPAVLASCESLSTRLYAHPERIESIKTFLGNPRIKVIVYLRRPDVHLESLYRQIIRGSSAITPFGPDAIDELIHPDYYDFDRKIRFYEERFGRDNIIVRVYDKTLFAGGTLFSDFIDAMGLPWQDRFTLPPRGTNKSMDARLMGLVRSANASISPEGGQLREFKELLDAIEKEVFTTPESRLFSPDDRRAFLARWEKTNRAVARRYFDRDALFPAPAEVDFRAPRILEEEDLHQLFFRLNDAWLNGFGAVPFPLYNYRKLEHLREKQRQSSGAKATLVSLQTGLHWLLHQCKRYLIPTRWPGKRLNKTIMRYVTKDVLLRGKNKSA